VNKLRWSWALIVAALFSDIGKAVTWRKARWAISLWFFPGNEPKASAELRMARLSACPRCPIYFNRFGLKTCGSPLRRKHKDLGCYCDIAALAQYEKSECWLAEQGLPSRWPERINENAQPASRV